MFIQGVYESNERISNNGRRHAFNIRVRPETENFQPDGRPRNSFAELSLTVPITVYSTDKSSSVDLRPRGVKIRWVSAPPTGYAEGGVLYIPVFRIIRFDAYHVGDVGQFLGSSYILVAKLPEKIRS